MKLKIFLKLPKKHPKLLKKGFENMFLYVFEFFFFHHFGSSVVVFVKIHCISLVCLSLTKTAKSLKIEKFQIAQKPSKTTQNGSKTCFSMFLNQK